jgi:hypothetical protein
MTSAYKIIRVNESSLRIDRAAAPSATIAFINVARDRFDNPLGWRLKPKTALRGSQTHLWATPEEAIASTALMTASQARAAIAALEHIVATEKRDAR